MGKINVLFGAGAIGKRVFNFLKSRNEKIFCFIDNDATKWGDNINGVPIIGLNEFLSRKERYHIYITCGIQFQDEIAKQLSDAGVVDYSFFDATKLWKYYKRETVVSFSHICDMEDLILYNVFHDIKDIFYIDVGANDPYLSSVTKLIYDHGGHGINIEPIPEMAQLYSIERPRDVIVCADVGDKESIMPLYLQGMSSGEGSTLVSKNIESENANVIKIKVYTLKKICQKYIKNNQDIHFLKIDVEGAEKSVILGGDFALYRPWCIVMESTLPNSNIPCHEEWEYLLINNNYHLAFAHGVNRYYVADEHKELDGKFIPVDLLLRKYRVFHAEQVD